MLFNDYPFLLVFLPAAILLYRLADPHPRLRIGVLVLLSFVFYSYWNPPFLALLVLSILINWLAARAVIGVGDGRNELLFEPASCVFPLGEDQKPPIGPSVLEPRTHVLSDPVQQPADPPDARLGAPTAPFGLSLGPSP